jgi:hypothetical protein
MSEQTLDTPPPVVLTRAEQQIADTKSYFVSIGLDPALVDAAVTPAAKAASGDPVQATIEGWRQAGISEAQISENLRRQNLTAPEDPRSDHEKQFDGHFPAVKVGEWRISHLQHPPGGEVDLNAYDRGMQEALSSMQMLRGVGEEVAEIIADLDREQASFTPAQKELWQLEQRRQLVDKWGDDGVGLYIDLAAKAVARAPEAWRTKFLASPAANSAAVVRYLALNEARLSKRSG